MMRRFMLAGLIVMLVAGMVRGEEIAPETANGVDLVYTTMTGQGEWNVFALDVDNPDARPVQLTHEIGLEHFFEEHPDTDIEDSYPVYQDTWRLDRADVRLLNYRLTNLKTGETVHIDTCLGCMHDSASPDGRYIVFHLESQLWLYDVAQPDELPELLLATRYAHSFWLNNTQFLYWFATGEQYFVYDVVAKRHFRLRDVLDTVMLTIDTTQAAALIMPEEGLIAPQKHSYLPKEITWIRYAWSPNGRRVAYADSDVSAPDGLYCDGCAVELYNAADRHFDRTLLARPGEQGGYHIMSLNWSLDGAYLLAEFYEIGSTDQPNEFWLIRLADDSARPVFHATSGVQWLH